MCCYQFKGGTGTASRVVTYGGDDYTVGVLVQANFGARRELTIAGIPLGDALADDNPMGHRHDAPPPGAGSIIAVIATDAPLLPGQCKALARRVRFIPWGFLDAFYEAVVRSVEEAVLNALVANEQMIGHCGRRVPALPRDRIAELLKARPSPD